MYTFFTALVLIPATSEPAPGSVTQYATGNEYKSKIATNKPLKVLLSFFQDIFSFVARFQQELQELPIPLQSVE